MARRNLSLGEEEIASYLQAGRISPQAERLATSHNPARQARGNQMMGDQLRAANFADQQEADVARKQKAQQVAADRAARDQERQAKAQADEAERQRMVGVRAAAAQGVKTTTDIQTGKRTIATHPDGAPVYKAGPQEQPFQVPGVPSDTVVGPPEPLWAQKVRDDRGNTGLVEPESITDQKTGDKVHSATDPTTGKPVKTVVGTDPEVVARAQRKAAFEQNSNDHALRDNNWKQAHAPFQAKWEPVRDAYQKRATEWKTASKDTLKRDDNGVYVKIDADTGAKTYPNVAEISFQMTRRANIEAQYAHAKAQHDKMLPMAENFNRVRTSLDAEKLRLGEEAIRMKSGMPENDGGTAATLAKAAGMIGQTPADVAAEQVAAVAKESSVTQVGSQEPTAPISKLSAADSKLGAPVEKPTAGVAAPVTPETETAFASIKGLSGVTLVPQKGYTQLQRNGAWFANLEQDPDGSQLMTLKDQVRQDADVNRIIANAGTDGVPVYLTYNADRPRERKQAEWVKSVYDAVSMQTFGEDGKPLPGAQQRIEFLGADPVGIQTSVRDGLLSVQKGEALMRDLWGGTLAAPDAKDPAVFRKWREERTAAAHAALQKRFGKPDLKADGTVEERWNDRTNISGRERVWTEFLGEYLAANQGRPGVDRAEIQAMMRQPVDATGWEKKVSAARTGGRILRDNVGGSMFGLAAGLTTGLGAAEMALFGDKDAKKYLSEWKRMVLNDGGAWINSFVKNTKTGEGVGSLWIGTEEGRKTMTALEDSTRDFQRVIDEEMNKPHPDRNRLKAAESVVREAAMGFHSLNNNPEWPVTAAALDSSKDQALGVALSRYAATGDQQEFQLYKERLMMDNLRRQQSADIEKKIGGRKGFAAAVVGGMYAGPQEIGAEAASTILMLASGGLSKVAQFGLKVAGATGKAARVASLTERMGMALEQAARFGVTPQSLINPLTKGQKVGNVLKNVVGTVALSGGSEMVEELVTEGGATNPNNAEAAFMGAFGGIALAPVGYVERVIGQGGGVDQRAVQAGNLKFANGYNAAMLDDDGFVAITPEIAGIARQFVGAKEFKGTVSDMVKLSRVLADPKTSEAAKTYARNQLDDLQLALADQTDSAVQTARDIAAETDPAAKLEMAAFAKVAAGNPGLLTPQERKAVQGRTTAGGESYFSPETLADGTVFEALTTEARAELSDAYPALRPLIRTTASDSRLSQIQQARQANEQDPKGPGGIQAAEENAPGAGSQGPAEVGGPGATGTGGAGPAADPASQVPPVASAGKPSRVAFHAGLEKGQYDSLPDAPPIAEAVSEAYAESAPVQDWAIRAAKTKPPTGWVRDGNMWSPPATPAAPAPVVTPAPEPEIKTNQKGMDRGRWKPSMPKAQQLAEKISQDIKKAHPNIVLVVNHIPGDLVTGGVSAGRGTITIHTPDIAVSLERKQSTKAIEKIVKNFIVTHEAIHISERAVIADAHAKSSSSLSLEDFEIEYFKALGRDFKKVPGIYAAAKQIYDLKPASETGGSNFESLKDWMQDAEVSRMLLERIINPKAEGGMSEGYALQVLGHKWSNHIRAVIEKLGEWVAKLVADGIDKELSAMAKAHYDSATAYYRELIGKESPAATPAAAEAEQAPEVDEEQEAKDRLIRLVVRAEQEAAERLGLTKEQQDALDQVNIPLYEILAEMPEAERKDWLDAQINDWHADLMDKQVEAEATEEAEEKPANKKSEQAKAARYRRMLRIMKQANAMIATTDLIQQMVHNGLRIELPNPIITILQKKRRAKDEMSYAERENYRKFKPEDGIPRQSWYIGRGLNEAVREVISRITAKHGSGQTPDQVAQGIELEMNRTLTMSDLLNGIAKELRVLAGNEQDQNRDPFRQRTDEEIRAYEAEQNPLRGALIEIEAKHEEDAPALIEKARVLDFMAYRMDEGDRKAAAVALRAASEAAANQIHPLDFLEKKLRDHSSTVQWIFKTITSKTAFELERILDDLTSDNLFSPASQSQDAAYLDAVEKGDLETAQRMVDDKLASVGAMWHGTPSGDLRGGVTGLHVGTKLAAMEALEARIGIPADGKGWAGNREYGKTLLAGKDSINSEKFGKYRLSGFNMDAPNEDYYPTKMPTVGESVPIDPAWKPWIRPVMIVGDMTNSRNSPISDNAANRRIKRKRGAFYTNTGEDSGSVSAVLPDGEHVRVKLADPVTSDASGNVIPLSERFNPASDSILYSPASQPDLFDAISKPENAAELGKVKVGSMSALGAYKALTAKRAAGKKLTSNEEENLLAAEQALGQKMAFDMGSIKVYGVSPATKQKLDMWKRMALAVANGNTKLKPEMNRLRGELEKDGITHEQFSLLYAGESVETVTQPMLAPSGDPRRSVQQSLEMGPQTDSRGQMSLFSPASQPGPNGRQSITDRNGTTLEAQGVVSLMSPVGQAYHGTPHKVDKFSLDKIGSGEGAQAYGWGLYFAQAEEVANTYTKLAPQSPWQAPRSGEFSGGKKWMVEGQGVGHATFRTRKEADAFKAMRDADYPGGNLYTVTLKVEDGDLLDWDKPLSEQSEKVRQGVREFVEKRILIDFRESDLVGPALSGALKGFAAQEAAETLHAAGILGIRYLDGNSRITTVGDAYQLADGKWVIPYHSNRFDTAKEAQAFSQEVANRPSYNYVIFDESDIEITHENGQTVSAQALFSPASQPGDVRRVLTESFTKPANQYEYESSTSDQPQQVTEFVARIASRGVKIELLVSPDLLPEIRRVEQATGAIIRFFRAPALRSSGIVSSDSSRVILVNADLPHHPLSAVIAHEMVHLEQFRARMNPMIATISEHLDATEFADVVDYLRSARKYDETHLGMEVAAFFVSDAVTGNDSIAIDTFRRGEELRPLLVDFFDNMPRVDQGQSLFSPPSQSPFVDIPKIARNLSKPPNQYEYTPTTDYPDDFQQFLSESGYTGYHSMAHLADTRNIERITGASIAFVKGPPRLTLGGNNTLHARWIILNTEYPHASIGYGIVHELVHVAQKDSRTPARSLMNQMQSVMSAGDVDHIVNHLHGYGYGGGRRQQILSEIQAFLVADAVMGTNYIGLENMSRKEELRPMLVDFFESLPKLNPDNGPMELFSTGNHASLYSPPSQSSSLEDLFARADATKSPAQARREKLDAAYMAAPDGSPAKENLLKQMSKLDGIPYKPYDAKNQGSFDFGLDTGFATKDQGGFRFETPARTPNATNRAQPIERPAGKADTGADTSVAKRSLATELPPSGTAFTEYSPEQAVKALLEEDANRKYPSGITPDQAIEIHKDAIRQALDFGVGNTGELPPSSVNAKAVESYGLKLPESYHLDGDTYRPTDKDSLTARGRSTPAERDMVQFVREATTKKERQQGNLTKMFSEVLVQSAIDSKLLIPSPAAYDNARELNVSVYAADIYPESGIAPSPSKLRELMEKRAREASVSSSSAARAASESDAIRRVYLRAIAESENPTALFSPASWSPYGTGIGNAERHANEWKKSHQLPGSMPLGMATMKADPLARYPLEIVAEKAHDGTYKWDSFGNKTWEIRRGTTVIKSGLDRSMANFELSRLNAIPGQYGGIPLRSSGPTPYSNSHTGVLYPDGHEVSTPAPAPTSLPDAGGTLGRWISRDGGRDAVSHQWDETGRDEYLWLAPQLIARLGDHKTPAAFWPDLAAALTALGREGRDPVDILNQLEALGITGPLVSENANPVDQWHWAEVAPGVALAADNSRGVFRFAKIPDAAEVTKAELAALDDKTGGALYSPASQPATPAKDAIDRAMANMRPKQREVFEAVNAGEDPAAMMERLGVNERQVANIVSEVRRRLNTMAAAAQPGGHQPRMRDGKIEGSPKLAGSAGPLAATHQARTENGLPQEMSFKPVTAKARQVVTDDFEGTLDRLAAKRKAGIPFELSDAAEAKEIIYRVSSSGKVNTPELIEKVAWLKMDYVDVGTEASHMLSIRRDPDMTLGERAVYMITDTILTPDPETAKRMRGATPEDRAFIIRQWQAKAEQIKADLKAKGYDIDKTLAKFRAEEDARRQAEEDNPRTKMVIDVEIAKLSWAKQRVIEKIFSGARMSAVTTATGMSEKQILETKHQFDAGIRTAMAQAAKTFREMSLSSPVTNMMDDILKEMGWQSDEDFIDTKPGYIAPELRPKTRTITIKPSAPKPESPPLTPEQQAALDAAWEKFKAAPPSRWFAFWQETTEKLKPLLGQTRFDDWKRGVLKPWTDLWQTEMAGIARPESKMTFEAWISKPPNQDKAARQERMFKEPINETTGDWADGRPFSGQGQLIRISKEEQAAFDEKTKGLFDVHNPIQIKVVADEMRRIHKDPSFMDKVMDFWQMSILTGLQTHVVNIGMNTVNSLYHMVPRRVVEAIVNEVLTVAKLGSEDKATLGEFIPMSKNFWLGIQKGAANAILSWKMETRGVFESYAANTKKQIEFDGKASPEKKSSASGVGGESKEPALQGPLGKIMRMLSYRAMTAADEFIKGWVGQVEQAAQAHRIAAVQEKLKGAAYTKRMEELMEPGSAAAFRAIEETHIVTYQEELDGKNPQAIRRIDQVAQGIMRGKSVPYLGRLVTVVVPFVQTPTNIFKQAIEMSPLGATLALVDASRALRHRVFRGEMSATEANAKAAALYNRARLVKDVTNQIVGMAIAYAVMGMVGDDGEDDLPRITGTAPYKSTKKGERDNKFRVMPPMTIRVGDVQFSYARFDPFAALMTSLVDGITLYRTKGGMSAEWLGAWIARFKDQADDKTFLQGVSNFMHAWEDPERFLTRFSSGILTGFVPNLWRQSAREADPMVRDTTPPTSDPFLTKMAKSMGYALVPSAAPPKITIWGDPVPSNRGELVAGNEIADFLIRQIDPTNVAINPQSSEIDRFILKWNMETDASDQKISISPIDDKIEVRPPGEKKAVQVPLTKTERMEANQNVGRQAKAILGTDWDWKKRSPERAKLITDVFDKLQTAERSRIRAEKVANWKKS